MQKRIFVISSAVAVFVIVFLIAFSAVCSISQFDVVYDAGSPQMVAASERIQQQLEEKYLRKNYLFFEEENIREVVAEEGGGYLEVTGIEKTFPNKISVSVKEKYEAYTFVLNDTYYVVGDDGTVLSVANDNHNNIAGRNIEVVGIGFNVPKVGEQFTVTEEYRSAYAALKTFIAEVNDRDMRGNILRITYGQDEDYDASDWLTNAWFIVETAEGVQIQIIDPARNASEKAKLALDMYENPYVMSSGEGGDKIYLGDEGRVYGYIYVTDVYNISTGKFELAEPIYNPGTPPDPSQAEKA